MKAHPGAGLMCPWQGCIRSSSCLPVVNKKFKYYEKDWRLLGAERGLCREICDSGASVISPQQHGQGLADGELELSQKSTATAKPGRHAQFVCQNSLGGTLWDEPIIRDGALETQEQSCHNPHLKHSGVGSNLEFLGGR